MSTTPYFTLKAYNRDLLINKGSTYLTADALAGASTFTVEAIAGVAVGDYFFVEEIDQQTAELLRVHVSTAPSGNTITLNAVSVEAHSRGAKVYFVDRNQVEFSRATTLTGSKTVLTTTDINPRDEYTLYEDVVNTTGFGFYRFAKSMTVTLTAAGTTATATSAGHGLVTGESITISGADQSQYNITASVTVTNATTFTYTIVAGAVSPATGTITGRTYSNYSESAPYAGFGENSLKKIFDTALYDIGMVSEKGEPRFSDKISREAAFQAVMDCQNELAAMRYKWSYLTNFDVNVSELETGEDSYSLPTQIAKEEGRSMIWNVRIGGNRELSYMDKHELNIRRENVAKTTLGAAISATSDTSITLTDSSDFGSSGSLQVIPDDFTAADDIAYTANNKTTNVVSGVTGIAAAVAIGANVWQNASFSIPTNYTIFENTIVLDPIPSTTYHKYNLYMDLYEKPTLVDDLADETQFPSFVIKPFVEWKLSLLRGDGDTVKAEGFRQLFEQRKAELLVNETNGQRFQFRPNRSTNKLSSSKIYSPRTSNDY